MLCSIRKVSSLCVSISRNLMSSEISLYFNGCLARRIPKERKKTPLISYLHVKGDIYDLLTLLESTIPENFLREFLRAKFGILTVHICLPPRNCLSNFTQEHEQRHDLIAHKMCFYFITCILIGAGAIRKQCHNDHILV